MEFWTDTRIPFEPKGSIMEMRNALRKALKKLSPKRDHILRAEFFSDNNEFFDVENILIYNIGTSTFRGVTDFGIHVLRSYSIPSKAPSGRHFRNLYKYSLEPHPQKPSNEPAISFSLAEINSSTKPHQVWWAMCSGDPRPTPRIKGSFSMYIEVHSAAKNFTNIIKPLVDGVICGMHPGRNIEEEAIARLADKTGWQKAVISENLINPPLPSLNRRKTLSSYRDFVKWDPADELCEEFIVVRTNEGETCRVWVYHKHIST